jgi:alpha-ketoglutarate-dependent taurine dioxygenase
MGETLSKGPGFKKFKSIQPKSVGLPAGELIREGELFAGQPLPLLIEPRVADVDLIEWGRENRTFIEDRLLKHGALLFRGFKVESAYQFERFTMAICDDVADDNGELPRSKISGKIYAVSYAPPTHKILWHNENTFCATWPLKLWFYCKLPPRSGGETPVVDNRRMLSLLDPRIVEEFARKDIMYFRNYGRGLDFSWQTAFQTDDKLRVEQVCRDSGIQFEWRSDDVLRTRSVRRAVVRHPKTGEPVWFNQACLWHMYCSPPEIRRAMNTFFREDELTRHCYFGDGSAISDSTMEEICAAYREAEVYFPWQPGDVMMIDNMLTAHARNPFAGPREILAALGEIITEKEIASEGSRNATT